MKVVVAIDSLKGSLSSMAAGLAVKEGICKAKPEAQVVVKPLADGGEGTTDALIEGLGGQRIDIRVTGPLGHPVSAYYGYIESSRTAIMEMAAAAGITLIPDHERDPFRTTTYGVGEMIRDAIGRGARDFIIGIGGSATNDGGIGMLKALGYTFGDQDGDDVGEGGQALAKITVLSSSGACRKLKECRFKIACDVTNPLCGGNGATHIYGPQKGCSADDVKKLDSGMKHYAGIVSAFSGMDFQDHPGAGAAGGLGFAFLSFLSAELQPGIELVLEAIGLEKEIADADIVVTGEGRLDGQTAMGKAPVGVARRAKQFDKKVIAFAGSVTPDASACNDAGIDAFFPILRSVVTLEEAMKETNAKANLTACAEQVFRLL